MLIQEACDKIRITKKSIYWYEQQGLIKISTNKNGYREFTADNIDTLQEITVLRKMGLSAKEIKFILNSSDKGLAMEHLLPQKLYKIEQEKKQMEAFDKLAASYTKEVIQDINEKVELEHIAEKLQFAIPGIFGQVMFRHFQPYLQNSVQTSEQAEAYINIVNWLDNTTIKIPLIIRCSELVFKKQRATMQDIHPNDGIDRMLNASDKELENFKVLMKRQAEIRKKWYVKWNPYIRSNNKLEKRLEKAGYYHYFIENMKKLSPSYNEYSHKIIALDEKLLQELGLKYNKKGGVETV